MELSTNNFSRNVPHLQHLTYLNQDEYLLGGDAGDGLEVITSLSNNSYPTLLSFGTQQQLSEQFSKLNNPPLPQLMWQSFGLNYIRSGISSNFKAFELVHLQCRRELINGVIREVSGSFLICKFCHWPLRI